MITSHWKTSELMEIWDGITLETKGKLLIRIHRGSSDLEGSELSLLDPFDIPIVEKELPRVISGEFWQITFPLTTYLMNGGYRIEVRRGQEIIYHLEFVLESRKKPTQVFLFEKKVLATRLRKAVRSFTLTPPTLPENFLLQYTGKLRIVGSDQDRSNTLKVDTLGATQKTIRMKIPVQPSYLPLDINKLRPLPDEYYIFNRVDYEDEPGLELSHPELNKYTGSEDTHYPIQVVNDVITHVHRNMRYVRQSKERGVGYAIKNKRGDCTEYAAFVTTLLRYVGLKARMVSGMGRSLYNYWIPHAFVEVYMYGTWVPLDPVKPPKPYLQLGNRGELIGIDRNNWLDPNYTENRVTFMAYNGIVPSLQITQKVTETGYKSFNKKGEIANQRNKLKRFLKRDTGLSLTTNTHTIRGSVEIEDVSSLLLVEGRIDFGKIVYMQYIEDGRGEFEFDITRNEPLTVILLDERGKMKAIETVNGVDNEEDY